jgi:hypothetical protein
MAMTLLRLTNVEKGIAISDSVLIPSAAQSAALEFLKDAGLELFVLFPDLQGLAEHLTREYTAERKKFLSR